MVTSAARQAPPGAKPNRGDIRAFRKRSALGPSPDRRPGWLLEAAGNDRPRGMAITLAASPRAIQNPAYRPAGALSFHKDGLKQKVSCLAPGIDPGTGHDPIGCPRHCEPTDPAIARRLRRASYKRRPMGRPDDRLREAIRGRILTFALDCFGAFAPRNDGLA